MAEKAPFVFKILLVIKSGPFRMPFFKLELSITWGTFLTVFFKLLHRPFLLQYHDVAKHRSYVYGKVI